MLRRLSYLPLAALLLWPVAAPAQTPANSPKPGTQRVEILVTFVAHDMADVDNLGVNFDLIPIPAPPDKTATGPAPKSSTAFLEHAAGNVVDQLYQTLTRTQTKGPPRSLVTTADNTPATFSIDTAALVHRASASVSPGPSVFPKLSPGVGIQGKLSLIPHVHTDGSITLDLLSPLDAVTPIRLGTTIPSGQSLVICLRENNLPDVPILSGFFRPRNKVIDTK